jgi:L-lactate dehydrogenase complex protein LldE
MRKPFARIDAYKRGDAMRVGFFVTCLVDLMRPDIGFAAIRLIESAGYEVVVPATQTCCGQPGYNSGDRASALALAEKVIGEFADCDYLVTPSGSCGGMIKIHYADLIRAGHPLHAQLQALAAKTYELTDFLASVAKPTTLRGSFTGRITYHDSCSGLRELGVKRQPRALLSRLAGVELTEMKHCEECCGFGGTFAVKYGNISDAIVGEKCRNIQATGADAVVLGDLGCMLNIEGKLRRGGDSKTRVLHVAQVLAGEVTGKAAGEP